MLLILLVGCNGSVGLGKDEDTAVTPDGCNLTIAVDGETTTWQYDSLDRLISSRASDGSEEVAITYEDGHVAAIVRDTGTTVTRSFEWDGDRLVGASDSTGYSLDLTWEGGELVGYRARNDVGSSSVEGEVHWRDDRPVEHQRRSGSGTIGGIYAWSSVGLEVTDFGDVVRDYRYDGDVVQDYTETWYGGEKLWTFDRQDGRIAAFTRQMGEDDVVDGVVYYDEEGVLTGYHFEHDVVIGGTCPRSLDDLAPGVRVADPATAIWTADDPRRSGGALCFWCDDDIL